MRIVQVRRGGPGCARARRSSPGERPEQESLPEPSISENSREFVGGAVGRTRQTRSPRALIVSSASNASRRTSLSGSWRRACNAPDAPGAPISPRTMVDSRRVPASSAAARSIRAGAAASPTRQRASSTRCRTISSPFQRHSRSGPTAGAPMSASAQQAYHRTSRSGSESV